MTVATQRHPASVVLLDGWTFYLAKDKDGTPQWSPVPVQTQEGDPTVPRQWKWSDWSRGLGDSRGWLRGTAEYCEYMWLGSMGRILSGPDITEVDTANGADVIKILEVTAPARRLLVFGGTAVKALDASHTVTTDGTPGTAVLDAELFHDQVAIALGDSTDFYRRNASGAYSANSISLKARAFGISGHELVRAYADNWSRCAAADFYGTGGNWSADYPIGDPSQTINKVFAHQRWDYVLKPEGLFTFDEENSDDVSVLNDLRAFRSSENRNWFSWDDQLFICSIAGLYRYIAQGAARPVGIEEVEWNESELSNVYPTAGIAFGRWAYVAYYRPSTGYTYIVAVRRAQEGDTGMGSPYTVVSVIDKFSGYCRTMGPVSDIASAGVFRLYYGAAAKVRHFAVTRDGTPVTPNDGGGTGIVWFSPTDCGNPLTLKYCRSIEAIVSGLAATRALQWKAKMDRGSANNVGAQVEDTGTGARVERFWTAGSNDSGRTIQIGLELELATGGTPEIRDVVLNYEERPLQTTGAAATLRLRDFDAEGGVASRKSVEELREKIDALLDGAVFEITDPYGDTYKAALQLQQGQPAYTRRGDAPAINVDVVIRRLDYS